MHSRFLVLVDKSKAKTSTEIREWVYHTLYESPGFLSESSGEYNFCSSMCDGFVIGGRWSGDLTWASLDESKTKGFWDEFEQKKLGWINNEDKKKEIQEKKSKKLFKKYFPEYKGTQLVFRDSYSPFGYPDDAKVVDKQIYDKFIKKYEGEYLSPGESDEIVNLDGDEITPANVIGMKWVIVVDYHM